MALKTVCVIKVCKTRLPGRRMDGACCFADPHASVLALASLGPGMHKERKRIVCSMGIIWVRYTDVAGGTNIREQLLLAVIPTTFFAASTHLFANKKHG